MAEVYIPDNCGMATLRWDLAGKTNPLTITIGFTIPGSLTTAADCADAISGCFDSTGGYCDPDTMGNDYTFGEVSAIIRRGGVLEGGASSRGPYPGTGGVYAYPPVNCTFLVQKKTAAVGRSKRGRIYLPNVSCPENAIDNMGYVTSDIVWGGIEDQWNFTGAALLALGDVIPAVLHSDPLETPNIITSWPIQRKMATQRRRMRR